MPTRQLPSPSNRPALHAPRLIINQSDLDMMVSYSQLSPGNNEINGYALVTQHDTNTFVVEPDSVFITEQEVQPGFAEVTAIGYLDAEERGFAGSETENRLRLQWHSHVWGTAVHSSTDLRTADEYGAGGNVDWMLWLVLNRRGEAMARLEQYTPIRMGMPIEVWVHTPDLPGLETYIMSEIAKKVTVIKPAPNYPVPVTGLFGAPESD